MTNESGTAGGDYINANYVDVRTNRLITKPVFYLKYGPKKKSQIGTLKYICTQAPLHNTVEDFHRMIWETKSRVIVMLTKNIEDGNVKAYEYLPKIETNPNDEKLDEEDKQQKFGEILVKSESFTYSNDKSYTITTFTQTKNGETRQIIRYQFLEWADNKVPETSKLLELIEKTNEEANNSPDTPIVIHCRQAKEI